MARRPTCLTFLPDQHKPLLREWLFLYPRFSFICGFCGACWHLSQNRLFSSKRHNRLLIRQYNQFSSFLTPSSSHQQPLAPGDRGQSERRAVRPAAPSTSTNIGSLRAPAHTKHSHPPCPALARNKGRRRVNHRDGRRTSTPQNALMPKNEEARSGFT